jgi:hypothetical protein
MTSHFDGKRECKLFSSLLRELAQGPSAFTLLNSSAQVDIESMAWNIVPENVRDRAIRVGEKLIRQAGNRQDENIQGWTLQFKLIKIVDPDGTWCVISANTDNSDFQAQLAREDVRPIFPY